MRCSSCAGGAPLVVGPLVGWVLTHRRADRAGCSEPAAPIAVIVVACYACARYRADLWGIAAVALMLTSAVPRYFVGRGRQRHHRRVLRGRPARAAVRLRPGGAQAGRADPAARGAAGRPAGAGGPRRAGPDRPRAPRRDRPLGERDGRADRGRPGPGHHGPGPRPAGARRRDQHRAAAPSPRPRGCCTSSATTPTSSAWSRCRGSPTWTASWRSSRSRGCRWTSEQSGDLGGLPAGVDVSTYRIVQEALTNARRYGAGPVSVEVEPAERQRADRRDQPGRAGDDVARWRSRAARHGRAGVGARRQPAPRRARTVGSSSRPCCRWRRRGPTVLIADDQDLVRSGLEMVVAARGCEVVGTAADGREAVQAHPRAAPGRRADGHPDAGARRDRGDPGDRRRVAADPGARAHDVRRRHLCLRRARRRGRGVPAQGDPAGPARRGHPHRRGGRGAARPDAHPEADRGARPPPGAVRRGAGGPVGPDRARGRGARADRARPVQRRDRRRRWSSRRRR